MKHLFTCCCDLTPLQSFQLRGTGYLSTDKLLVRCMCYVRCQASHRFVESPHLLWLPHSGASRWSMALKRTIWSWLPSPSKRAHGRECCVSTCTEFHDLGVMRACSSNWCSWVSYMSHCVCIHIEFGLQLPKNLDCNFQRIWYISVPFGMIGGHQKVQQGTETLDTSSGVHRPWLLVISHCNSWARRIISETPWEILICKQEVEALTRDWEQHHFNRTCSSGAIAALINCAGNRLRLQTISRPLSSLPPGLTQPAPPPKQGPEVGAYEPFSCLSEPFELSSSQPPRLPSVAKLSIAGDRW